MFQDPTATDSDAGEITPPDPAAGTAVSEPELPGEADSEPDKEPVPGIDDIFDIEPPVEVPWWEPWMIYTAAPGQTLDPARRRSMLTSRRNSRPNTGRASRVRPRYCSISDCHGFRSPVLASTVGIG